MKSSELDLSKRGFIKKSDLGAYKLKRKDELIKIINSDIATERTIAVRLLSQDRYIDNFLFDLLISRLQKEKCLYTKIEICEALQNGDNNIARKMTCLLGNIGNNQYKTPANKVSLKKYYPLPRDIIARILSKMKSDNFAVLLEVLQTEDKIKISEVLDAIRFMGFYNQELATLENANFIYKVISENENNLLIMWKAIICLSAFPILQTKILLKRIINENSDNIICEEGKRSLRLIENAN